MRSTIIYDEGVKWLEEHSEELFAYNGGPKYVRFVLPADAEPGSIVGQLRNLHTEEREKDE